MQVRLARMTAVAEDPDDVAGLNGVSGRERPPRDCSDCRGPSAGGARSVYHVVRSITPVGDMAETSAVILGEPLGVVRPANVRRYARPAASRPKTGAYHGGNILVLCRPTCFDYLRNPLNP